MKHIMPAHRATTNLEWIDIEPFVRRNAYIVRHYISSDVNRNVDSINRGMNSRMWELFWEDKDWLK